MKAKILAYALPALILATIHLAEARQQSKIPKIGWLSPGSASRIELFLREFRKLGYVEGKNISIETRYAEDKLDRLPALADELVRLKVDVLLTPGGNAALALKNATRTIPIVFFGAVSDPVALGLVESLARPGGNVTGFTTISAVLVRCTVPKPPPRSKKRSDCLARYTKHGRSGGESIRNRSNDSFVSVILVQRFKKRQQFPSPIEPVKKLLSFAVRQEVPLKSIKRTHLAYN